MGWCHLFYVNLCYFTAVIVSVLEQNKVGYTLSYEVTVLMFYATYAVPIRTRGQSNHNMIFS